MIGSTVLAIGLIIDRWWWRLFMIAVLAYCIWFFATAVDAYLVSQMNLWSQNLGM